MRKHLCMLQEEFYGREVVVADREMVESVSTFMLYFAEQCRLDWHSLTLPFGALFRLQIPFWKELMSMTLRSWWLAIHLGMPPTYCCPVDILWGLVTWPPVVVPENITVTHLNFNQWVGAASLVNLYSFGCATRSMNPCLAIQDGSRVKCLTCPVRFKVEFL